MKKMSLGLALLYVSIIIRTVLDHFGSKRTTVSIIEISKAIKEVTRGNFDIELKGNSRASEVNVMAKNFMLMGQKMRNRRLYCRLSLLF